MAEGDHSKYPSSFLLPPLGICLTYHMATTSITCLCNKMLYHFIVLKAWGKYIHIAF